MTATNDTPAPSAPAFPGLASATASPTHLPAPRRTSRAARALTRDELASLTEHLPATPQAKAWTYWAPRLVLYAGLTGPEVARLTTEHVNLRRDGMWITAPTITVRADDARLPRALPMHPMLRALGFETFAHTRYFDAFGHVPLFPDLHEAKRPGDAIDSWLRRATRAWGGTAKHGPSLRDLRWTAGQAASDGGASAEAVAVLLGDTTPAWDDRGGLDRAAAEHLQAERLREAIAAIDYGSAIPGPAPAPLVPAPSQPEEG